MIKMLASLQGKIDRMILCLLMVAMTFPVQMVKAQDEYPPSDPLTEVHQVYLPGVQMNYCYDFKDDFSSVYSGWEVMDDDDQVNTGYVDGEYQIASKESGYRYLIVAPTCAREYYQVEVDARWQGETGSIYGIFFGMQNQFDQFIYFQVSPDYQGYWVIYRNGDSTEDLVEGTYSSAINSGNSVNRLKVVFDAGGMNFYINDIYLTHLANYQISGVSQAGLFSAPYSDYPNSDARFDNFSIASVNAQSGAPSFAGAEQTNQHLLHSSVSFPVQERFIEK